MTEAFQTFSDKELQAWETSFKAGTAQEIPPSRYLLRPSGSLKSEVIHHLNQPSYTSNFGYGRETADPSNGCIAMVMGNLFDGDKSLIFDQIHRRERESRGLEEFPEPVVNCHNDFTKAVMESSEAKVEIIWGKVVRDSLNEKFKITHIPLWGEAEGISIGLLHEENFKNQEFGHKYRRILIFVMHPQRIYYEPGNSEVAAKQDKSCLLASKIAGGNLPFDEEYFRRKKWRRKCPSMTDLIRKHMKLGDSWKPKSQLESTAMLQGWTPNTWEECFDKWPHSTKILRELIPSAIEGISSLKDQDTAEWTDPSFFEDSVLAWFRGLKQILFRDVDVDVRGPDDIVSAYKLCACFLGVQASQSPSLREMLHCILLWQKRYLDEWKEHTSDKIMVFRFDCKPV